MKYNLNEKIDKCESQLWVVMKDGNHYLHTVISSKIINVDYLYEGYINDEYDVETKTQSHFDLVTYIEKNIDKPEGAYRVDSYVHKFMSEQLLTNLMEELKNKEVFNFIKNDTIYSKDEFKKAYVKLIRK